MTESTKAVFLSYASQDAEAARRICEALRAAGIEVWFDQSELRSGDAWDSAIRKQIKSCSIFIPIISKNTNERGEGYFRLEWKLAVDRSHLMAANLPFLVPVVIDAAADTDDSVPDRFRDAQWTRLPAGEASTAFVERVCSLLSSKSSIASAEGRSSDPSAEPHAAVRHPVPLLSSMKVASLVIATVVIIAAVYFALDKFVMSNRLAPGGKAPAPVPALSALQTVIPDKSIAVLPFVDMSEKKDQEYFADGMAEEILDELAKIPGLRVIGRTSSFQFKGKNEDLRKIGTALGAAHLVEGSVRRSGDHVRVTAQLIRSLDGAHQWSATYDRNAGDVLKVQQEIAISLARALQVTVEASSVTASELKNPDAYDLFLRGLNAYGQFDKAGLEEAISDFQNALQLEPSLARADDELALAQFVLADDNYTPARTGFEQARRSADYLLKKNPKSLYGHALLSRIHADYDWDWVGAKQEADKAIAINPHAYFGLYAAGVVATFLGQWDEGERNLRAALSLDPLNADCHYALGSIFTGARRFPEALSEYRRALEISPTYAWAHGMAGLSLLSMGQPEAALREIQSESMEGVRLSALVSSYHALGRKAESDAALAQLTREWGDRMPFNIATSLADRGETDRAFEWLERAYRQKDNSLPYIKGAINKNLQRDPRYRALLHKMNLPE